MLKNYDLTDILRPYENEWVALSNDRKRVLASGKSLKEVADKVVGEQFTLMKVLPFDSSYAP